MLEALYIIAILVESITGALAAGRYKMDVFGVMLISIVTAIGGGTIRDVLLDMYPLTWVEHPKYILMICFFSVLTMMIPYFISRFNKAFLILDAIGLITFSVLGVNKALEHGYGFTICIVAGMASGVFGGIIRDILCNRIPLVFQKEIYAGVSIASSILYLTLYYYTEIPVNISIIITLAFGFSFRMIAIHYKLGLPIFIYSDDEFEKRREKRIRRKRISIIRKNKQKLDTKKVK